MNKIIILTLILSWNLVFSQSSVVSIIANDLVVLESLFNDNIFIEDFSNGNTGVSLIEVKSKDSIHVSFIEEDKVISINIYKVLVSFKQPLVNLNSNGQELIFEYFLIKESGNYYRLFGFYSTDIKYLLLKLGDKVFISLSRELVRNKILTNKQRHVFIKSLKKEKREFPTCLNRPCQVLKYYFTKKNMRNANTIILPMEPLKSYIAN